LRNLFIECPRRYDDGKTGYWNQCGGTPEQVGDHERGVLAEPHSAISLADAIRFYLKNPAAIQQHGLKAQEWSKKNHDWKETLQAFLKLYSSITLTDAKS